MLHMMLGDQTATTEHDAHMSESIGFLQLPPSQIVHAASAVVGDLCPPGPICANSGQAPQPSAYYAQEGGTRDWMGDNLGTQLRYHPYPVNKLQARASSETYSVEVAMPRHYPCDNTFSVVSEQGQTSYHGNTYERKFESLPHSRNSNSNNNNTCVAAPAPFPTQPSKATSSYPLVYNSNLPQQQPYSPLVYTSAAGTSVLSGDLQSPSSVSRHYFRTESSTMSSSPDALGNESKELKKRGTKKRKKKGANEPQRPVSAYALFFRDTQAAIKAENSSATFGEISKIVASMWDSLSEEDKQVYKQKTENAKRDYLKQLAAFRANMISKGSLEAEAEEEDSQPLSVLREKIVEQRTATSSPVHHPDPNIIDLTGSGESRLPPPPKLHPAPHMSSSHLQLQEPQLKLHPLPSVESSSQQMMTSLPPPSAAPRPISPVATFTKIIVPGQNGAQSTIHVINSTEAPLTVPDSAPTPSQLPKHIFIRPALSGGAPQGTATITPSPPPPIKLRNIATHQPRSPITIVPSKPGQIIKVLPSGDGGVKFASISPETMKGRVVKMVDIVRPVQAHSPGSQLAGSASETPTNSDQTPILQLLHQESVEGMGSELNSNTVSDEVNENDLMQIPEQNLLGTRNIIAQEELSTSGSPQHQNDTSPRQCVREGCTNPAVSCPYWDNEYCSNECVYSHCRDVFDAWMSTRQVTTSAV